MKYKFKYCSKKVLSLDTCSLLILSSTFPAVEERAAAIMYVYAIFK